MRQTVFFAVMLIFFMAVLNNASVHAEQPSEQSQKQRHAIRVVALGDSLTSGYGLQSGQDFPAQLQHALQARGMAIKIDNAGVSGDTSAGGKARLEWAIAGEPKPSMVILALGANDMLRGIDPATTRKNLSDILDVLKAKNIPVFFVGMKASVNMGDAYRTQFDALYDDLAKQYHVAAYYPFFLDGVAMNPALNQNDGIHPNIKGVDVLVKKIAPLLQEAIRQ